MDKDAIETKDTRKIQLLVREELSNQGLSEMLCKERHRTLEQRIEDMQKQHAEDMRNIHDTQTKIFNKLDKLGDKGHTNVMLIVQILSTVALALLLVILQGGL